MALGQYQTGQTSITYIDASRSNRSIPCQIYYPASTAGTNVAVAPGEFPIVVFGHGFLIPTSEYSSSYDPMSQCGYIMIFPETETGFPDHLEFGKDMSFALDNFLLENNSTGSLFFQKLNGKSAFMGHSMGGGAAFLAADINSNVDAMVTFAAAETTPSAIAAAANITIPSLTLAGSDDCVTPPSSNQIPMYNNLASSYKAYIEITGGAHCQFGNDTPFAACSFGELGCQGSLTPAQQHTQMLASTKPFLDVYLMEDCSQVATFSNYLSPNSNHTHMESGTMVCCQNNLVVSMGVPSGLYNAIQTVWSDGTINASSNVQFVAGTSITLDDGFCAPSSSVFEAYIGTCP